VLIRRDHGGVVRAFFNNGGLPALESHAMLGQGRRDIVEVGQDFCSVYPVWRRGKRLHNS